MPDATSVDRIPSRRQGPGGGVAAENEHIEVLEIPFEALWRRLDAGEIHDAKTLIGLQWLRARL